jgi:hypothetical protein
MTTLATPNDINRLKTVPLYTQGASVAKNPIKDNGTRTELLRLFAVQTS